MRQPSFRTGGLVPRLFCVAARLGWQIFPGCAAWPPALAGRYSPAVLSDSPP